MREVEPGGPALTVASWAAAISEALRIGCDQFTWRARASNLTEILESRSIGVLEFEWHDAKSELNLAAHGVSFELAKTVFLDPFAVERLDDRDDYGEARFVLIGMASGAILLFVANTEREDRIRLISAPRATTHEQNDYYRQNS